MKLGDELSTSPGLRLGLTAILLILSFYGMLEWHDHQLRQVEAFKRLSVQVKRNASSQSMVLWPLRALDARSLLVQYERRLWRQDSYGQAQAELQDWLRQQLRVINAQNATIKVTDAQGSPPRSSVDEPAQAASVESALTRVSARIEFANADPQVLLALLAGLAAEPRQLVVDSLVVKAQRVDVRVSAWYQLGAPAAAVRQP